MPLGSCWIMPACRYVTGSACMTATLAVIPRSPIHLPTPMSYQMHVVNRLLHLRSCCQNAYSTLQVLSREHAVLFWHGACRMSL